MNLLQKLASVLKKGARLDEAFFSELEEKLIEADVGLGASQKILNSLKSSAATGELKNSAEMIDVLKSVLTNILTCGPPIQVSPDLHVVLVVGVNGTGKTTTIAKLANHYSSQKRVMLACCDTYRAAAGEQLRVWAQRLGVDSIIGHDGADPASVAFDAVDAAMARGSNLLIIDTAGRQHTRAPLMDELSKIKRVLGNKVTGSPHEVLLVLDATTGQNALSQAQSFTTHIGVTGIVLSKLDGTAKGGIVIAIADRFGIPIRWIGVGEGLPHLEKFDPQRFVNRIFD